MAACTFGLRFPNWLLPNVLVAAGEGGRSRLRWTRLLGRTGTLVRRTHETTWIADVSLDQLPPCNSLGVCVIRPLDFINRRRQAAIHLGIGLQRTHELLEIPRAGCALGGAARSPDRACHQRHEQEK
ncbi:MAG: hypothetical protein JXA57_11190 [Armatimonadetes bacterium]|nr:hypothetical protein [Armatimonadota bacterium]